MVAQAATIVDGLKQGDECAQRQFWKICWPQVYGVCVGILGGGVDSNDVANDLMSDFMMDYVHRLSHPQALYSYLRLMAVRRSLRLKAGRDKMVELNPDQADDRSPNNPEQAAAVSLMTPKLEYCLSQLTSKAQQVVRLRYSKQMTNEKIGALVGGSKQYIGRLLRTSIELLRKCIELNGRRG